MGINAIAREQAALQTRVEEAEEHAASAAESLQVAMHDRDQCEEMIDQLKRHMRAQELTTLESEEAAASARANCDFLRTSLGTCEINLAFLEEMAAADPQTSSKASVVEVNTPPKSTPSESLTSTPRLVAEHFDLAEDEPSSSAAGGATQLASAVSEGTCTTLAKHQLLRSTGLRPGILNEDFASISDRLRVAIADQTHGNYVEVFTFKDMEPRTNWSWLPWGYDPKTRHFPGGVNATTHEFIDYYVFEFPALAESARQLRASLALLNINDVNRWGFQVAAFLAGVDCVLSRMEVQTFPVATAMAWTLLTHGDFSVAGEWIVPMSIDMQKCGEDAIAVVRDSLVNLSILETCRDAPVPLPLARSLQQINIEECCCFFGAMWPQMHSKHGASANPWTDENFHEDRVNMEQYAEANKWHGPRGLLPFFRDAEFMSEFKLKARRNVPSKWHLTWEPGVSEEKVLDGQGKNTLWMNGRFEYCLSFNLLNNPNTGAPEVAPFKLDGRRAFDGTMEFDQKLREQFVDRGHGWNLQVGNCEYWPRSILVAVTESAEFPVAIAMTYNKRELQLMRLTSMTSVAAMGLAYPGRARLRDGVWFFPKGGMGKGTYRAPGIQKNAEARESQAEWWEKDHATWEAEDI